MSATPKHVRPKSWLPREGLAADTRRSVATRRSKTQLGLRVFLAVVTVLFSLIVVAYVARMGLGDWRTLPVPGVLWWNTAALLISSAAMHWATIAARNGRIRATRIGLLGGGIFACAFLVGQLWAWQELRGAGYFATSTPAASFFYLITALHGLHLLGGLVAWGKTTGDLLLGAPLARVRLSVDLCAVYWHYLLAAWLVLFGLMLST